MRWIALTALWLVVWALLGCGESRHDIDTGGNGTLSGLTFSPSPQTLGIDTGENFDLEWRNGYEPPAHFTAEMERVDADGSTHGVYSYVDTVHFGHYRLSPASYLEPNTFYRIIVADGGTQVRAMYLTGDGRQRPAPAPRPGEPPQMIHEVTTAP